MEVKLTNTSYIIDVYDTPLGVRWLDALRDNLVRKKVLEKNFCFLGWADSKRDLRYLVKDLNKNIDQINSFHFDPPYERIGHFTADDFQYSSNLPMGNVPPGTDEMTKPGLRLKHEACNLLHRYFEDLQGTAWNLSEFYQQADFETKYSIRQLNNICHEIEAWVSAYRKKVIDPHWIRPSQITTFLNAARFDLHEDDFELFKINRYARELGGVYLHWSQVGKTLFEVFRDEGNVKIDDTICSTINHQRYYSGEFDVEWGRTITEQDHDWKKNEMDEFRQWLKLNDYEWEDPKLSLGYAKIGQINLEQSFGPDFSFEDIYKKISDNLDITSIGITGDNSVHCEYPYTLESDDWRHIQMEALKHGYK